MVRMTDLCDVTDAVKDTLANRPTGSAGGHQESEHRKPYYVRLNISINKYVSSRHLCLSP
jgi:hypothetical protein